MEDSSGVWRALRAPTCRAPSGARGHLDLGPKCLVQTGLDSKSPFNSNGFRPRRKPDWPVYWQPCSRVVASGVEHCGALARSPPAFHHENVRREPKGLFVTKTGGVRRQAPWPTHRCSKRRGTPPAAVCPSGPPIALPQQRIAGYHHSGALPTRSANFFRSICGHRQGEAGSSPR
jgi:hypothetical protein